MNIDTIDLLIKGNEEAFNTIYKEYYKSLYFYASRYIPLSECEEIVQETMMWLWENKASLITELSIKSLLFTIAKNKCLNTLAHKKIQNKVYSELFEKFNTQFSSSNFPLESELINLLDAAINKLPEEYKQAFVQNRFDNKTYAQIAELSGVSAKTIAYRISQALKILRIQLKDYLPLVGFLFI